MPRTVRRPRWTLVMQQRFRVARKNWPHELYIEGLVVGYGGECRISDHARLIVNDGGDGGADANERTDGRGDANGGRCAQW